MALNYQILGKKIQLLRTEHKISQLRFAEMIEKSPTFVSRMERGVRRPSLETLVVIANLLETSLDNLLAENMDLLSSQRKSDQEDILMNCTTYERFVLLESMPQHFLPGLSHQTGTPIRNTQPIPNLAFIRFFGQIGLISNAFPVIMS